MGISINQEICRTGQTSCGFLRQASELEHFDAALRLGRVFDEFFLLICSCVSCCFQFCLFSLHLSLFLGGLCSTDWYSGEKHVMPEDDICWVAGDVIPSWRLLNILFYESTQDPTWGYFHWLQLGTVWLPMMVRLKTRQGFPSPRSITFHITSNSNWWISLSICLKEVSNWPFKANRYTGFIFACVFASHSELCKSHKRFWKRSVNKPKPAAWETLV